MPERLDGRGIETLTCGKLPLDRPFHQSTMVDRGKNIKSRISSVFSGVCQVVHFMCNLLVPQVWLEFSGSRYDYAQGFPQFLLITF
jgi:hypothetical protein